MDYVIYQINVGYLCDYEKSTKKGLRPSVTWNTRKAPKLFTKEQAKNWLNTLYKHTSGKYLIINKTQREEMIKAA
jgi:hypothetical protein